MARSLGATLLLCAFAVTLLGASAAHYRNEARDMGARLVPALKAVLTVMADARQSRLLETQLLAMRSDEGLRTAERLLNQQHQSLQQQLDRYTALDALDQQLVGDVRRAALAHWATQQQVVAAARRVVEGTAPADTAVQLSNGTSHRAYEALATAVDGWRLHSEALAEASNAAGGGTLAWRLALAAVLVLAALVWACHGLRNMARSIHEPLAQAERALRAAACGRADYSIKVQRLDEFGRLLVAIDGLRDMLALSSTDDDADTPLEVSPSAMHSRHAPRSVAAHASEARSTGAAVEGTAGLPDGSALAT